ncbi:hypothetical protein [Sphingomonas sp. SORGH_AS_0879]|uniref:hypothetical protein n=1 Tax=Sphingomonas sp. SORGH_AS_0879 TaxID=3041790 RepID=UPI0027828F31|nr:hypothetical protein [Sphingomonas sp. SORGH_AS_0879]MDQ1228584.1 hypothetical protein [Sphingomonas sp. SORGH_AS_0879]
MAMITMSSDSGQTHGASHQSQFDIRLKTDIDSNIAKRVGSRLESRINNRIGRTTSIDINQETSYQNSDNFVTKVEIPTRPDQAGR